MVPGSHGRPDLIRRLSIFSYFVDLSTYRPVDKGSLHSFMLCGMSGPEMRGRLFFYFFRRNESIVPAFVIGGWIGTSGIHMLG